jgi:hypothetical protein
MWVFKSLVRNSYLATNPKVMGSTLLHQTALVRYTSKARYIHFLLKELSMGMGPEYIMLVRNPYYRVESYFREKLRQKVKRVLSVDKPYILKRHQEIFYPFLGIKKDDSNEVKVEALLSLEFNDFISLLPKVYEIEDHLAPQTYNFTRSVIGFKRIMKMNRYIHVENRQEMAWLSDYLKLDFSLRVNSSLEESNNDLIWSSQSIEIVKKLYREDFRVFGYGIDYPS